MEKKNELPSPQKQTVKSRSKSTDEIVQAKKAFHTPQISLPGRPELEKLKVIKDGVLRSMEATESEEVLSTSEDDEALVEKAQN